MPFLILLAAATAHAACEAPTDVVALSAYVPSAQLAMGSLDADGFSSAVEGARSALPCLAQPLTPIDAAGYHGLEALAAFAEADTDAAMRSFASAIAATPDYRLPTVIAPPGGDVDTLLRQARELSAGESQALPPYDGIVMVDGARALVRPTGRPCVLQLVGPRGDVRATYYLFGSEPTPRYDPPPTLATRLLPELRQRPSAPFAVAAGTTAIAAGGLYWLGGTAHARYVDPSTPYDDLPGLKAEANAALGGSVALGITAAMLTTLTFLEW